jgi:hypothetical protein
MTAFELFALLVLGHYVADYPMQGQFIALGKNRACPIPGTPWYQILFAHAYMHGGMVAGAIVLAGLSGHPELFTLALPLAAGEVVLHWLIDDWKCRREARCRKTCAEADLEGRRICAYNLDQSLHFACKLAWTAICAYSAGLSLIAR